MIGRFLSTLSPEQEERVLTSALIPWITYREIEGKPFGCLGGAVYGHVEARMAWADNEWLPDQRVANHFNAVCMRLAGFPRREYVAMIKGYYPYFDNRPVYMPDGPFDPRGIVGGGKAGELIRNRILRNQARRALQGVRAETLTGAQHG